MSVNIGTTSFLAVSLAVLTLTCSNTFHMSCVSAAPNVSERPSATVDSFLTAYYDDILSKTLSKRASDDDTVLKQLKSDDDDDEEEEVVDLKDQMMGDQPQMEETVNGGSNSSEDIVSARDRLRKESWMEYLKSQIFSQLRRKNSTAFTKPPEEDTLTDFNLTQIIPKLLNTTILDDDLITEKIRSFYPLCETPADQDQWRESDDVMNLFFNLDYNTDNKNSNIASATLRLYRLPQNITNRSDAGAKDDCKNNESVEEERLLRVSAYWYAKLQKKRRVKRRLSDSKVVPETSRWVELSVKPATKSWTKAGGRMLGLGILVEDQEGKPLRADKYFKGPSCTVGVSTPKPIPTIIRDESQLQAELDRIHSLHRRNSTSTVYSDLLLLPTIDICYLEFPDNTDISQFNSARINACNLRKMHEERQLIAERERLERLATLHLPNNRHFRHQRQHRQSKQGVADLATLKLADMGKIGAEGRQMSELERNMRNSMSNKQIVLTREELEALQRDRALTR
ncbi:uncharacterized protein LOC109546221 isoform X2 [Dendroctonus ponderosae]|uniref:uncharacterized protein LOC109546221 isoform X2 n=1 Tax=Dendroctonus ponderosae TaxID=77166 RepID=UPI0020364FB4|nr:uncharacterized protein LOC109546221 isoform X2 [Dendroctonus ponderosae]